MREEHLPGLAKTLLSSCLVLDQTLLERPNPRGNLFFRLRSDISPDLKPFVTPKIAARDVDTFFVTLRINGVKACESKSRVVVTGLPPDFRLKLIERLRQMP